MGETIDPGRLQQIRERLVSIAKHSHWNGLDELLLAAEHLLATQDEALRRLQQALQDARDESNKRTREVELTFTVQKRLTERADQAEQERDALRADHAHMFTEVLALREALKLIGDSSLPTVALCAMARAALARPTESTEAYRARSGPKEPAR